MKKVIDRIVDYAVRISDPEEVIVFGSMANGTYNVHSDLDLLIVLETDVGQSQIAELVRQYAHESAISADVLVRTTRDLERAAADPASFLAGVMAEGKTMYGRPTCATTENLPPER